MKKIIQEIKNVNQDELALLEDFFKKALNFDPKERVSAQELINHKWLVLNENELYDLLLLDL
jgi:hypothetical protein